MRVGLIASVLLLTACGTDGGPAGARGGAGLDSGGSTAGSDADRVFTKCSPDIGSLTSGLFEVSCSAAGCHGGAMAAAALDFTSADVEARLIGQSAGTCDGFQLVVPGKPDESLLVLKLEGKVPADCGEPMPPTGPLVSAEGLTCVREWVASLSGDASVGSGSGCETCGGATCIELSTDALHCGSCSGACPAGSTCSNGQCDCPGSLNLCDARCVDFTTNAAYCGSCSKSCGTGALCSGGTCECGPGLETCTSGCAELLTDPLNCGGCGIACGPGKFCTPSGCGTQVACTGLTKCGSACVDTATSLMHCGGCNMPCGAGEACVNGGCACPGGGALCGGACVDTSANAIHCGGCDNACPEGTTCKSGVCECPGGGAACGGECIDLQADLSNCGKCGNVCAPGQACEAGQCTCSDRTVSFAADVAPVLERNCTNAGCHAGTRAKAELDLTVAKSYAELVNVKTNQCNGSRLLVDPGQPSSSYLVQKLLGVNMCTGTQMPKAGTSLPAADLEAITAWICQGAPK